MSIKKKSDAMKFLEKLSGGPLTFGKMMRSIRMGEEATLKDYSDLLDISVQHLSDIENNRRVVSPERAAKFAKLLGYHEAQFVEMAIQEQLNHVGLEKFKVNVS